MTSIRNSRSPWRSRMLPLLAALTSTHTLGTRAQTPLEEVTTISSRIEVPLREVATAVSVISAEEIRLRGYDSIADVLRTQPGIGASNNGGTGKPTALRIRGEEGYRTRVMVDGVEISDPSGTQVRPAFEHLLTASEVERIEILRGAQGFIYGADAGGVVNILTRAGEGPLAGEANVGWGAFDTRRVDARVSGGGEAGDFFLSVSNLATDGYNARTADTDLMDDDGYENTTVHTKLGWAATEKLRLQLVARDVDAENEFDGCGFPTTNDCRSTAEQTTFKISGDYQGGNFTHLLALGHTDVERRDFSNGEASFATEGSIRRGEYAGSATLKAGTTLVYGVDAHRERVVASGGDVLERDQTGVYLEYQGSLSDSVLVTAGARHDDNEDFGRHTSVRVSAAHVRELAGGATLKYRASYGTGFRAPSLSEIAYNAGPFAFPPAAGVILTEESSAGFDVGMDYVGASGWRVAVTYFHQEIDDEIFFDLAGFSGYLQSPGTSLSRGVELAAEYPVTARWTLLGNATFNDTEDQNGRQRIRRPRQQLNLGVRFASADEKFRFLANYRSSGNAVDEVFGSGRVPLDDYGVLDLSAAFAVGDHLEAYGRLENVTDEEYQEIVGFRSAGFAAHGGVRVRF